MPEAPGLEPSVLESTALEPGAGPADAQLTRAAPAPDASGAPGSPASALPGRRPSSPRVGAAPRGRVPATVALAGAWVALMLLVALLADVVRPYGITAVDLRHRLAPPLGLGGTAAHLLGTDELGRDVLSRLLVSVRASLGVAFGATVISGVLGTTLGFVAAHRRGLAEAVVLTLIDAQAALPFLVMALALLAFLGGGLPLFVCLMGLYGWERHARLARALALAAGGQGYAGAVRQLGAGPARIYLRHVLPNVASTLIVSATIAFPEVILQESGLSFLGLGVQPPASSLGTMVGYGREYITRAPWILLAPSVVIVLTTLCVSVLGDWLRDRLDPTLG